MKGMMLRILDQMERTALESAAKACDRLKTVGNVSSIDLALLARTAEGLDEYCALIQAARVEVCGGAPGEAHIESAAAPMFDGHVEVDDSWRCTGTMALDEHTKLRCIAALGHLGPCAFSRAPVEVIHPEGRVRLHVSGCRLLPHHFGNCLTS